jgi:hypothetical protein
MLTPLRAFSGLPSLDWLEATSFKTWLTRVRTWPRIGLVLVGDPPRRTRVPWPRDGSFLRGNRS